MVDDGFLSLEELRKRNRSSSRFFRKVGGVLKKAGSGVAAGSVKVCAALRSERTRRGLRRMGSVLAKGARSFDRAVQPGAYGKKVRFFNKEGFERAMDLGGSKEKRARKDPFSIF